MFDHVLIMEFCFSCKILQFCLFSGVRAFANSFADYELTQKTDTYIHYHMSDILKGPEITNLPYLQVDIVGKKSLSLLKTYTVKYTNPERNFCTQKWTAPLCVGG